VSNNKSSKKII